MCMHDIYRELRKEKPNNHFGGPERKRFISRIYHLNVIAVCVSERRSEREQQKAAGFEGEGG